MNTAALNGVVPVLLYLTRPGKFINLISDAVVNLVIKSRVIVLLAGLNFVLKSNIDVNNFILNVQMLI